MTEPTDDRRDPQTKGVGIDAEQELAARRQITDQAAGSSSGGQVSEVGAMDASQADTPISDDQSVAGQPDGESGTTDEGPTGPNARVDEPGDGR